MDFNQAMAKYRWSSRMHGIVILPPHDCVTCRLHKYGPKRHTFIFLPAVAGLAQYND